MGIAFVPLYVDALGAEAYGLIGVFTILQAGMTLLDFGLTPTLTREMARLRAGARTPLSIRNLLRSLEMIYILLAIVVAMTVWFSAPLLNANWIKSDHLSSVIVIGSIRIMGLVLATRWLEQLFRGALQGLQDLIWLNIAQAILATLRWGGAYVVVAHIDHSIISFFIWQGLVSIVMIAVLILRTYRLLPPQLPGHFDFEALREIRSFAGGMFAGTLLTFLLTQADKVVISKALSLEQLAYYTLASTIAGGLLQLIIPMNTAVYPRLTALVARTDTAGLARTYEKACEWIAMIVIPPALLLAFFPVPTLLVWSGNLKLAEAVAPVLTLLALGTLCNGLMNMPYMLQLAYGWTSLSVKVNIVAVIAVVPGLVWAVPRFGVVGAAATWLILNAAYLIFVVSLMHQRILRAEKWRWITRAAIIPLVAGGVGAFLARTILPTSNSRTASGIIDSLSFIFLVLCVGSTLPSVRRVAYSELQAVGQRAAIRIRSLRS
jgi:O-antigen/teichoic acid export membrane protein